MTRSICQGGPSSSEARCLAAQNLGTHVNKFLTVAHGKYPSYEDKLLATCNAGDELLRRIGDSGAISSLVADKLLSNYKRASFLGLSPLDYKGASAQVKKFREEATQYVQKIHRAAFKTENDSTRHLLSVQLAEIEYGELILQGISQCMATPRKELDKLSKWKSDSSNQAQEVSRLKELSEMLRQKTTSNTRVLWMQLNLWPLVLILALSLKFAKGAATYRKERYDKM